MSKLTRKLKVAFASLPLIWGDAKEFGWKIAVAKYRRRLGLIKVESYINIISDWMQNELKDFNTQFSQGIFERPVAKMKLPDCSPVWVCWLQGEKSMPEICKASYRQLQTQLEDNQRIFFLTFDNIHEYIELPDYIWELHQHGVMTPVALTDIIRHQLLATMGGVWIDSQIFVTGKPFHEMLKYELFTVRFDDVNYILQDASRGKWVNGFLCVQGNGKLFSLYCYNALIYLWKRHRRIIDYLQLDYIIWAAYRSIPEIAKLLDAIPINNPQIRLLNSKFNEEFDEGQFRELTKTQHIHLVNRHINYSTLTQNGKLTYYGKILK